MNILPKKNWHVRTKDNIARVRRDEAAAREEQLKKLAKHKLAESEARLDFLRKQAAQELSWSPPQDCQPKPTNSTAAPATLNESTASHEHINLFDDYENHIIKTSKELEREKKAEQEKYEKRIGYLTYLGQDTNEALKVKSWYELAPKRVQVGEAKIVETDLAQKYLQDPLTLVKALLPKKPQQAAPKTAEVAVAAASRQAISLQKAQKNPKKAGILEKVKHKSKKHKKEKKAKKSKKHKKEKKEKRIKKRSQLEAEEKKAKLAKLQKMAKKIQRRERQQDAYLNKPALHKFKQKYNSQFNPDFAKQNM